jgi:hypothetical protein
VQDRPLRRHQQPSRLGNVGRVACRAVASPWHVLEAIANIRRTDVARNLQQDWPGLTVLELRERPRHQLRDAVREVDPRRPLGDVLVDGQRIELRRLADAVLVRAAGDDQHRDAIGVGLREAAERVLDAGTRLHHDHGRLRAVQGTGVAVRHVDQRLLAAGDDRSNADSR